MGPHGLLIGATGSGKSELLRTLVASLAITHSSEELNFVLVDFKGGATFASLDELPHTSAVITNLADELPLVDRMQDALHGELMRRQELLRAAGNYVSLLRLREGPAGRRAAGPAAEPARHLRRVQRAAHRQAGLHRPVRHDRPARAVARRAPAAGLASGWRRAGCAGSRRTCRTGSACARSPPWRAGSCSACRTPTSCPAARATATSRPTPRPCCGSRPPTSPARTAAATGRQRSQAAGAGPDRAGTARPSCRCRSCPQEPEVVEAEPAETRQGRPRCST